MQQKLAITEIMSINAIMWIGLFSTFYWQIASNPHIYMNLTQNTKMLDTSINFDSQYLKQEYVYLFLKLLLGKKMLV